MKEMFTFKGHRKEVTSISWHPWHEKLFVSGSYEGGILFWLVGNEKPQGSIPQAHEGCVIK
jgi:polyadenylation factor subunit 2